MVSTARHVAFSTVVVGMLSYLLAYHLVHSSKLTNLALAFTVMWLHLALKATSCIGASAHTLRPRDADAVHRLRVDVVVPVYNEDPHLLAAGILSMARQTRTPHTVWLVDDGSRQAGHPFLVLQEPVVGDAIRAARAAGVTVVTHRQENAGKRWAQSVAFRRSPADIFITVDSDTVLRPDALEQILVPFARADVHSVAGAAYGQNYRRSLFTRVVEVGFVMSFIQGRMAEGAWGSVRVNCGIFAAYRGDLVRDNLDRYLHQRFLGRPVKSGDDRALTFFAKERGRTEFQPTAIAYSALPERLGHLVRQRLRWSRSWCWGALWLLRRPVLSADFAFTLTQVLAYAMLPISLGVTSVGVLTGAISPNLLLSTLLVSMGIGVVAHARYVLFARRGEPLVQRVLTWLVSPLYSLLYLLVLLPLQYYAFLRPRPQKTWGTRSHVEVTLDAHAVGGSLAFGPSAQGSST